MPFVNVRTAKGLLNKKQKTELCTRLTDVMVEVEGGGNPDFRKLVSILIEEHDYDSWCLDGLQVSLEAIRKML